MQVPDYSKYRMTVQTSKQPVADWSNSSEPLEEVAEGTISELSTPSDLFMRIKRKHGWETIPRSDAELLQKKQGDEHAAD